MGLAPGCRCLPSGCRARGCLEKGPQNSLRPLSRLIPVGQLCIQAFAQVLLRVLLSLRGRKALEEAIGSQRFQIGGDLTRL